MKIATDEVDAHGVGSDPDAMLALRARNDPEAFGLLYARYVHRVTSYFLLRTGIREDAEDLASQCFVRAFEALPRFRAGEGSVRSWLFAIAHNLSVSHYRAHRDTLPIDTVTLLDHAPPLEEREISADDALNGLSEDDGEREPDGELGAAIAWLHEALKDGPLPSKQVFAEASENGIARSTLKRAKLQAGILSRKVQEPDPQWLWALPPASGEQGTQAELGRQTDESLGSLEPLDPDDQCEEGVAIYKESALQNETIDTKTDAVSVQPYQETQEDQGTQGTQSVRDGVVDDPLASALPNAPDAELLTDPWDDNPDWPAELPSYDCATCLADEPEPAEDDVARLEWPAPRGGVPEVIIVAPEVEDRRCDGCTRILAWGEARCRHCDKPPADPAGPVTIDASAWSRTDWAAWIGGGGNQCYHCGVPLRDDRRHCPTCRAALDLAGR